MLALQGPTHVQRLSLRQLPPRRLLFDLLGLKMSLFLCIVIHTHAKMGPHGHAWSQVTQVGGMTFPSSTSGSSTIRELGARDLELQAQTLSKSSPLLFKKTSAGVMMVSDFLCLWKLTLFSTSFAPSPLQVVSPAWNPHRRT